MARVQREAEALETKAAEQTTENGQENEGEENKEEEIEEIVPETEEEIKAKSIFQSCGDGKFE